MVIPEARKSNSKETQIRVPRTHGLPKQTLGSTEIRLKSGFMACRSFRELSGVPVLAIASARHPPKPKAFEDCK